MTDSIMRTYNPQAVRFVRGQGCQLWDDHDKVYLDAISGIAVCGLGHAHPAVANALCEQGQQLIHTSNLYQIANQQRLADRLCQISGMQRVFFSNSGAEANEAAIKLARLYGHQRDIERPKIIVMDNSFHGRTMATLSATGNHKIQAGFEPLVEGFVRAPFNDLDAIRRIAENEPDIVAVLVEPVQGEGGIRIPEPDYLNGIRQLCDQHHWLMMLDEIQTGVGRSGKWFAFQHNNIHPDVMTLAKGLGNGVPIGACLARGQAADVLQPGTHGSTFGGNPLVCHVAGAVIDALDQCGAVDNAANIGHYLIEGFKRQLQDIPEVTDIRGLGLLIGIELDRPCAELVAQGLEQGILINVTAERVIRLLPPLILNTEQADQIINIVSGLIKHFIHPATEG